MTIQITQFPTWAPLLAGVVIPFLVALLTKLRAHGLVKAAVALVLAGLTGLGAYVANVDGSHTWKGALTAFVLALLAAGASRVTVTGGLDTAVAAKTPTFGLGKSYVAMGVPSALPGTVAAPPH